MQLTDPELGKNAFRTHLCLGFVVGKNKIVQVKSGILIVFELKNNPRIVLKTIILKTKIKK